MSEKPIYEAWPDKNELLMRSEQMINKLENDKDVNVSEDDQFSIEMEKESIDIMHKSNEFYDVDEMPDKEYESLIESQQIPCNIL